MKTVTIDWDPRAERFVSEGGHRGHLVAINAPRTLPEGQGRHGPSGFSPAELLLASAGSCAAWDVVEIVHKQRQDVRGISVQVDGVQADDPPWGYHTVVLRFRIRGVGLDARRLRRAVALAVDRYCSVVATIRGSATVTTELEVIEEGATTMPHDVTTAGDATA